MYIIQLSKIGKNQWEDMVNMPEFPEKKDAENWAKINNLQVMKNLGYEYRIIQLVG
jgi:hypothetical protein